MSATIRAAWAMLNLPTLLALVVALGLIVYTPPEPRLVGAMIPVAIATAFALLAAHISRVLQVGVWRLLPNGFRTAIRAVASIVTALSLSFGALTHWTATNLLPSVPYGTLLAYFIHFSLLGLLLLLGIGRQLPRLLCAFYFVPCVIALGVALDRFENVPAFWMAGAAVCAAAWTIASFANLRAPNYSRRRISWEARLERLFARADGMTAIAASPAQRLLRFGRAGFNNALVAIVALAAFASMQHLTIGRLQSVPFLFFVATPILCVGLFAGFHASRFGAPARRLWLLCADSRRQLFGLVERVIFKDVCVVAAASWAVVVGLALLRGVELDPLNSAKLFVSGLGVSITLAYVGLLHSAVHRWWARLLVIALGVVCLFQSIDWWFDALGVTHPAADRVRSMQVFRYSWLALALIAIAVLRYVALVRWKRIDWSHYRSAGK